MQGTSKVIMGATLIMVVSLAIILSLVLVLLAELYCSLLLHRRKLGMTSSTTTNTAGTTTTTTVATTSTHGFVSQPQQPLDQSAPPSLCSFYAQGVIQAPRSFLFPQVSINDKLDLEKQHSQPSSTPHLPIAKVPLEDCNASTSKNGGLAGVSDHFMYISNPIYNSESGSSSRANTPFKTPDTSPSRLETGDSSGDDIRDLSLSSSPPSLPVTPPLTPMKKLPAEACSVSLRDARCLGTSGSDSNSNKKGVSSSSSGSPCTSPSW
ncbi:unnamed protein product [Ilex paraguariensis]|uniref:Uncharacterized protein n=1 Tax=Ilex paraguariensis TaxID=185542 RepID=A0ABC8TZ88_9AQUA